jgi:Cu2+-exporting ATPase
VRSWSSSRKRRSGVDHVIAGALPEQSAERIRAWREEGKRVCFVGDGINDSIALRAADVSVSLAGAATIAADTANVVLLDGNLERDDKTS